MARICADEIFGNDR